MRQTAIKRLRWALDFGKRDPRGFDDRDWMNARYDLCDFIKDSVESDRPEVKKWRERFKPTDLSEEAVRNARRVLRRLLRELYRGNQEPPTEMLKDVGLILSVSPGEAYDLNMIGNSLESAVVVAFVQYVIKGNIHHEQVRACPTCGNIFLNSRKPRKGYQIHCSIQCSRLHAMSTFKEEPLSKRIKEGFKRHNMGLLNEKPSD